MPRVLPALHGTVGRVVARGRRAIWQYFLPRTDMRYWVGIDTAGASVESPLIDGMETEDPSAVVSDQMERHDEDQFPGQRDTEEGDPEYDMAGSLNSYNYYDDGTMV